MVAFDYKKMKHPKNYILCMTFFILLLHAPITFSLTLENALKMAKDYYPVLQSRIKMSKQARDLYISSYDPYFPTISIGYNYRNAFDTTLHNITYNKIWDTQYSAYVGATYRLFDGGFRRSKTKETYYAYKQTENDIDITENELAYSVKQAFYTAMAAERIYIVAKDTEQAAQRNYDLSLARRQEGIARFSDVTQAQVRLTQSKMDTVSAGKDMEKAFSNLNSLIGLPLDDKYVLEEEFQTDIVDGAVDSLQSEALRRRAEVDKQLNELEIVKQTIKEQRSNFWPKVDFQIYYNWYDRDSHLDEHEAALSVGATFNLFDGLGRFYRVTAQKEALYASQKNLLEAKRSIKLEVNNAYKDIERSYANYQTALNLVKEGEVNYNQAFNEYKVGKGDIIALIQAEINLARSRITLIQQKMDYNIAVSSLEKALAKDINN
jgi:outer membrane protein TolC